MLIESMFEKFCWQDSVQKLYSGINVNSCELLDVSFLDEATEKNKPITIPFNEFFVKDALNDATANFEYALYVKEINPETLRLYSLCITENAQFIIKFSVDTFKRKIYLIDSYSNLKEKEIQQMMQMLVGKTLLKISAITPQKTILYKSNPVNARVKDKQENKNIKFQKPVYIYIGKTDEVRNVNRIKKTYNKIQYIHSWNVRGHWRKLDNPAKRGKDSFGKYIVEGFTWVKPYVKGCTDKIVNKLHIVIK